MSGGGAEAITSALVPMLPVFGAFAGLMLAVGSVSMLRLKILGGVGRIDSFEVTSRHLRLARWWSFRAGLGVVLFVVSGLGFVGSLVGLTVLKDRCENPWLYTDSPAGYESVCGSTSAWAVAPVGVCLGSFLVGAVVYVGERERYLAWRIGSVGLGGVVS